METDHLREFKAFAQTMNYTAASKQAYVSQPALVAHIAALEKHAGTPLVDRSGDVPRLTPAGKYLLSEMGTVLDALDELMAGCRQVGETTLCLSIRNDTAYFNTVLTAAEELFGALHPGITVEFTLAQQSANRTAALACGAIDFDIGAHYCLLSENSSLHLPSQEGSSLLFPQDVETGMFWVSQNSPLFGRTNVEPSALSGHTLLLPETPSSRELGKGLVRRLAALGTRIKAAYRPYGSLHEYYMTNRADTLGFVGPSTKQSIGFIGPNTTKHAFGVQGLDLSIVTYTAYNPDSLDGLKLDFVKALEEVGRMRCEPYI